MSWSITEEKRKEKRIFTAPFLRSVIPRRKNVFLEGIRLDSAVGESRDLVLHQVGQIWCTELSICRICAESRDLEFGHGFRACSFKNKRKKLDFHTFWDQEAEKRKSRTKSVEFWSPEL